MNAKINDVELEILQGSVVGEENIPWDFVLMGDMFYEEIQSSQSIDWLNHLHKQGKKILIGDPGRLPLQKHRVRQKFELLAEYKLPVHVVEENPGFTYGYVWRYYNL